MPDDLSKAGTSSPSDLSPSDFSTRGIPNARRGYEKKAVDALVAKGVERWSELYRAHTGLLDEIAEMGGVDHLARELGTVGTEVRRILEAAEAAAAGLRDRAREAADRLHVESSAAADTRLSEASAEADRIIAEAEAEALALRQAAWEDGTRLLENAAEQSATILEEAGEEKLRLRAEGEREAHRRLAATRKEADDLVRTARFEADRQLNLARELAAEIIRRAEQGGGEVSDPGEAREQRAEEALSEIDQIHAGRSIEGVAVLPAEPAPPLGAGPLGTDRASVDEVDLSESLAAEVERLMESSDVVGADLPTGGGGNEISDIGTLFEALRTTAEREAARPPASVPDVVALRDRTVLGLHNAGLREVKRRLAGLQDGALDGLRGSGWTPSGEAFTAELRPLLDPLITRAAAAGAAAARRTTGVDAVSNPGARPAELVRSMTDDLVSRLRSALSSATGGPEETASEVNRVFRAWRTDEAERWVRTIVTAAYHDAMLTSLSEGGFTRVRGVPSGTPCPGCPGAEEAEWDPAEPPLSGAPPVNIDCRCSFEAVQR